MQTLPVLCCSDSVNTNLQMYPWCAKKNFIVELLYSLISVIFCCSIYSRHNCSLLEAAGKIQQFFFSMENPEGIWPGCEPRAGGTLMLVQKQAVSVWIPNHFMTTVKDRTTCTWKVYLTDSILLSHSYFHKHHFILNTCL